MSATAQQTFRRGRGALGQTMATALVVQGGLFVTGPLVARMLGVEDRGHLAELTLWPTVIATIVIWGLPTALAYERAASGPLPPGLVRGVTLVAAVQAAVAVAIHVIALTAWMPEAWGALRVAGLVSLLLGPVFIGRDYTLAVLQGARDFDWFNRARLSHLVVYVPLTALLFLAGAGTLSRILWISVIATLAISAVAVGVVIRKEPAAEAVAGRTSLRGMLAFGQQAHLGRLMPIERFRADQLAIALFLSPTALGLYAVASALTNVMRFLTQAIGYVAFPTVASERDAEGARRLTWRYVRLAIVISAILVAMLEVGGPWLIRALFGGEFEGAGPALRLMLPGVGFVGVRRVLAESLRGDGLTLATTMAEVVTVCVFLTCFYPLLSIWGLNGIAATVTLAEGFGLAALLETMFRSQRRLAARALGAVG